MKSRRSFVLIFISPIIVCLLLGAAIFGGQAYSEKQEDKEIQQTISESLKAAGTVEVAKLQRVQHGYGVCGIYRVASSDDGYSSFYYDAVNRKVVFDVDSQVFESNCGLASLCDAF